MTMIPNSNITGSFGRDPRPVKPLFPPIDDKPRLEPRSLDAALVRIGELEQKVADWKQAALAHMHDSTALKKELENALACNKELRENPMVTLCATCRDSNRQTDPFERLPRDGDHEKVRDKYGRIYVRSMAEELMGSQKGGNKPERISEAEAARCPPGIDLPLKSCGHAAGSCQCKPNGPPTTYGVIDEAKNSEWRARTIKRLKGSLFEGERFFSINDEDKPDDPN